MADDFNPANVDIRLRSTWGATHKTLDARIDLRWEPGGPGDRAAEERVLAALGDGWQTRYQYDKPAVPLAAGVPRPAIPGVIKSILTDLEAQLERAGIEGAYDVHMYPTGWIRIAQVMVHHMTAWAAEGDQIEIAQIKEKFGSLRCYVDGSERVRALAQWCEAQSEGRCMLTGEAGKIRDPGWLVCLSDGAWELWQRDKDSVMARMYPR